MFPPGMNLVRPHAAAPNNVYTTQILNMSICSLMVSKAIKTAAEKSAADAK
jgi:hypothetical protein